MCNFTDESLVHLLYGNLENESIFSLLTKLCEKFTSSHSKVFSKKNTVKSLRSKCYDILIFNKRVKQGDVNGLENKDHPLCHLLAWEFIVRTKHDNVKHANKVKSVYENIVKLKLENTESFHNILYFLINLRNPPQSENIEDNFLNLALYPYIHKSKFEPEILSFTSKYTESDFCLKDGISKEIECKSSTKQKLLQQPFDVENYGNKIKNNKNCLRNDDFSESSSSSNIEDDVWELACQTSISDRRTWESLGVVEPEKEPPFVSEANREVEVWMQDLKSAYSDNLVIKNENYLHRENVSYAQFVRDVKYLLVGISSKSFQISETGDLYLVPNTKVEGLSTNAITSYCQKMLLCGSYYKGLVDLSSIDNYTGKYKQEGHIFKEICGSINRYLSYYRVAILSLPNDINLLALQEYVKCMQEHLSILASICKVGYFKQDNRIEQGIELLNYFYQKILTVVKKDILMVLYSVFYPCCQLYFHRFLGQWVLEGDLNDSSAEFFIASNAKYLSSRGRTYWTRGYLIKEDVVPDFLVEIKDDILACGKAMNLLKLCVPNSPLCSFLMEKKPVLFRCCITPEQLINLEQSTYLYYLNAISKCGPQMSLKKFLEKKKLEEEVFLGLVAKKRTATLKRIELERQEKIRHALKQKEEEMMELKKQYDDVIENKRIKELEKFERDIKAKEEAKKMELIELKIFHEEAQNLINYYNELFDVADKYKESIQKNTQNMKNYKIEESNNEESESTKSNSSHDTFYSVNEDSMNTSSTEIKESSVNLSEHKNTELLNNIPKQIQNEEEKELHPVRKIPSLYEERSLAALKNRDRSKSSHIFDVNLPKFNFKLNTAQFEDNSNANDLKRIASDNRQIARKNKLKYFQEEYGENSHFEDILNANTKDITEINATLNKQTSSLLKVESEELASTGSLLTQLVQDNYECLVRNRRKMLQSEFGWCDNFPYDTNANVQTGKTNLNENLANTRALDKTNLKLDLKAAKKDDKVTPMSLDTPLNVFSTSRVSSTSLTSEEIVNFMHTPTTAGTTGTISEEEFKFEEKKDEAFFRMCCKSSSIFDITKSLEKVVLPDRISFDEAQQVSANCLKLYLEQSVAVPLKMQKKLVNNELLKYFMQDLKYLEHLNSLRNYFFLLDGHFAKTLTDTLFEKLYNANYPSDLINWRNLNILMQTALEGPMRVEENSDRLSFRINTLPKTFDLANPEIFDCISLTYKITWPLNILIPSDVLTKYDDVFKLLLKLRRVSWVLQKIFTDLKCLVKRTEPKLIPLLFISPQYKRLHQCRHIMTHFVQSLQSYIHGEVFVTSWQFFEENLAKVHDLDNLYDLHTVYLKNILTMCLLNQKSFPLRKVMQKVFSVIFKYYDYLRSREWVSNDGIFEHPNFKKLEDIFKTYEEIVTYFFRISMKVVKSGCHKDLQQLLEILNVNDYYIKSCNLQSSVNYGE